MDRGKIEEVIEKQVLTVAQAVEDKIDEEIAALERLDDDDLEALRERRLQQMKKMSEKRSRWISLGHGEYTEIPSEKDFFSIVKASERVVCHFFRENWPCKVSISHNFVFYLHWYYFYVEFQCWINYAEFNAICDAISLVCLTIMQNVTAGSFEFLELYQLFHEYALKLKFELHSLFLILCFFWRIIWLHCEI